MKDIKWTKVPAEKAPDIKNHILLSNYMANMKRGSYTQTAFVKVSIDPTVNPPSVVRHVQFGSEADFEWHVATLPTIPPVPPPEKK